MKWKGWVFAAKHSIAWLYAGGWWSQVGGGGFLISGDWLEWGVGEKVRRPGRRRCCARKGLDSPSQPLRFGLGGCARRGADNLRPKELLERNADAGPEMGSRGCGKVRIAGSD